MIFSNLKRVKKYMLAILDGAGNKFLLPACFDALELHTSSLPNFDRTASAFAGLSMTCKRALALRNYAVVTQPLRRRSHFYTRANRLTLKAVHRIFL